MITTGERHRYGLLLEKANEPSLCKFTGSLFTVIFIISIKYSGSVISCLTHILDLSVSSGILLVIELQLTLFSGLFHPSNRRIELGRKNNMKKCDGQWVRRVL